MVCFKGYIPTERKTPSVGRRNPPSKRPIQVSEELHALISMMATDGNQSLEQVVSSAILKQANSALNTSDSNRQRQYLDCIHKAKQEIKERYHGERSRRSAQMRKINNEKRAKTASTPSVSPTTPPRSLSPNNHYGYPIEYRYGIPIPKPPASSYPTYSSNL